MLNYKYKQTILSIIPRRGIPHDRDETKALQSFYKDTLFHEFDHACPLCGINIPHMLIASHIKPFRDCAHIYEAIDHNNGLLLCRNHDYLLIKVISPLMNSVTSCLVKRCYYAII